jgi:hypothetical protein
MAMCDLWKHLQLGWLASFDELIETPPEKIKRKITTKLHQDSSTPLPGQLCLLLLLQLSPMSTNVLENSPKRQFRKMIAQLACLVWPAAAHS